MIQNSENIHREDRKGRESEGYTGIYQVETEKDNVCTGFKHIT